MDTLVSYRARTSPFPFWTHRAQRPGRGPRVCAARGSVGGDNFVDAWFLDGGQLVCAPEHADPVLRALDIAVAQAGASRPTGADAKNVARVAGSLASREAFGASWQHHYGPSALGARARR